MSEDEIIKDDGAMPGDLQLAHTMTADVTGTSNNQNVHARRLAGDAPLSKPKSSTSLRDARRFTRLTLRRSKCY